MVPGTAHGLRAKPGRGAHPSSRQWLRWRALQSVWPAAAPSMQLRERPPAQAPCALSGASTSCRAARAACRGERWLLVLPRLQRGSRCAACSSRAVRQRRVPGRQRQRLAGRARATRVPVAGLRRPCTRWSFCRRRGRPRRRPPACARRRPRCCASAASCRASRRSSARCTRDPAGPPRRGRRAAGRRQGVFAALVGACRPVSTLAALQVYVGVAGAGCEERRCVCGDGMRGGPQRHLHAERLPP